MEDNRSDHVKLVVSLLEEKDLKHAEDTVKESYKNELDRKDKILTSMSVITAPITILFAGVAFLTNNALDSGQGVLISDPDIALVVFYAFFVLMVWKLVAIVHSFNKLLSGENYHYLPNASNLLNDIVNNKEYCNENNIVEDGAASRFSRVDTIIQLAESSSRNCNANDIRLGYRQSVFRNTIAAIVCAALGFIAVAAHREWPNMKSVSKLWEESRARQSENSKSTTIPSTSTLGSGQTAPGNQSTTTTSPGAITPSGH